jgi:hypothetical protein
VRILLLPLQLVLVTRGKGSIESVCACGWTRTRGAAVLLQGALSRRRSSRRRPSWSKGDRSRLRRRRWFLPAGVQKSSSTSRLSCHCGGLSATVQQAPASPSQVA